MTSAAGFVTIPGANAYGVARWQCADSAISLADLLETGVGVTLLAPSEVDSPYFDHNPGSRGRIPPDRPPDRHDERGGGRRRGGQRQSNASVGSHGGRLL